MEIPQNSNVQNLLDEISNLDLYNFPDNEFDRDYDSNSIFKVLGEPLFIELRNYGFNTEIQDSFEKLLKIRQEYLKKEDTISEASSEFTQFMLLLRSGAWNFGNLNDDRDKEFDENDQIALNLIRLKMIEYGLNIDMHSESTQTAIFNSVMILSRIFDKDSANSELKFLLFAKHVMLAVQNLSWSNYIFRKESQRLAIERKKKYYLIVERISGLQEDSEKIDKILLNVINSAKILNFSIVNYGLSTINDVEYRAEMIESYSQIIKNNLQSLSITIDPQIDSISTYLAYRIIIIEAYIIMRKFKTEEFNLILDLLKLELSKPL